MTPKEKAQELVESYKWFACWGRFEDEYENLQNSKKCALIAVEFAREFITGDLNEKFDKFIYLQDIKEEIEKL